MPELDIPRFFKDPEYRANWIEWVRVQPSLKQLRLTSKQTLAQLVQQA